MHVKETDVFHCFLEEGEKSYWLPDDKELLAKKYRKVINQTNEQPKIVHMLTSMHDTSSWAEHKMKTWSFMNTTDPSHYTWGLAESGILNYVKETDMFHHMFIIKY